MIEINLLPKDYRKSSGAFSFGKTGLYIVSAAAGIVVVLIAITFYQISQVSSLKSDIDRANQRASMLREDIRVVDALTDVKNKIHRRINGVEKLDRHRSAWVRILEDISRNTPEFVWLNEFRELPVAVIKPVEGEEGEQAQVEAPEVPSVRSMKVKGYTFTLNALAATMIRMMRSDYFDEVELIDSKDTLYAGEKAYLFELAANVHYLSEEELRNMIGKAKTKADSKTSHASLN
ncbi:MAG: PilN domain-containing protein [candidate division Zixibacteria bacterium]|nr:PilN domain-containing protein [candidate division Zixibacteria bacterium]